MRSSPEDGARYTRERKTRLHKSHSWRGKTLVKRIHLFMSGIRKDIMFVSVAKLNKSAARRRSGCVVDKQVVGAQAAHQLEP